MDKLDESKYIHVMGTIRYLDNLAVSYLTLPVASIEGMYRCSDEVLAIQMKGNITLVCEAKHNHGDIESIITEWADKMEGGY